jgi:hypothetical protein
MPEQVLLLVEPELEEAPLALLEPEQAAELAELEAVQCRILLGLLANELKVPVKSTQIEILGWYLFLQLEIRKCPHCRMSSTSVGSSGKSWSRVTCSLLRSFDATDNKNTKTLFNSQNLKPICILFLIRAIVN